ncbi:MAG: VIT1/CCC1 transporter family protein [Candidatus Diapherotrites archaeon]
MPISKKKKTRILSRSRRVAHQRNEHSSNSLVNGEWLRDLILGGQDGLVNVLGLVLGVAAATQDTRIVVVAGLAAMFAEGISMGAVAYTSSKASIEFLAREKKHELKEIEEDPEEERDEVRRIYFGKGFRGKQLEMIVQKLTANRDRWLQVMLADELHLQNSNETPLQSAIIVTIAALIGALFPILPFFFFPVSFAMGVTVLFSLIVLFIAGALKGHYTKTEWWRSGAELAIIGTGAALIGYVIGSLLSVPLA